MLRSENFVDKLVPKFTETSPPRDAKVHPQRDPEYCINACSGERVVNLTVEEDKSKPFELYKRRTTIVVRRKVFLDVICEALTEYKYVGPNQRADLILACR